MGHITMFRILFIFFCTVVVSVSLAAGMDVVPGLSEEELCAKEQWSSARILVWAHPGRNGQAQEAGSWMEYSSQADYLAKQNGQPATRPPDKDSDIILPDSTGVRPYVVGFMVIPRKRMGSPKEPQLACRHITIGRGAGLDGGCIGESRGFAVAQSPEHDTGVAIYGNVVVKDGGYIYGKLFFCGDKHTYYYVGKSSEPLCRDWTVRKTGAAGVLFLNEAYDLAKGIKVESGRLILPAGCQLQFNVGLGARLGNHKLIGQGSLYEEGYVAVLKEGTLELRPGVRLSRKLRPRSTTADFRIEGLLQIGQPDGRHGDPVTLALFMEEGEGDFLTQSGGLYIRRTAEVQNLGELQITTCQEGTAATTNMGVSVFLEKPDDLGRVKFDHLRAGGIAMRKREDAESALAGATFGENCVATGEELFSTFDLVDFEGGMGSVEFVDGLKTDCRILYPHAGRLIVRSKGFRTLQSFDLATVHATTIDGKRIEFNAKRTLTGQERDDRAKDVLWGDEKGAGQLGRYADQEWSDCPVMVWARPGVSGARFTGPNWLDETGTPYFDVPLISQRGLLDSHDVDMLLPAASNRYVAAGWGGNANSGTPPHRHLTIERNASYGSSYNIQGNLWMKHGSGLGGWHMGMFADKRPDLHRFLRFHGERVPYRGGGIEEPLRSGRGVSIAQWGHFQAGVGGTVELIGEIQAAGDRLYIAGEGMMILSEKSCLLDGARAAVGVMPGATLALLQDASVGTAISRQQGECYASIWVNGTLRIGLPERPIQRDMDFPLSGVTIDRINRDPSGSMRIAGTSFVLSEGGRFIVHSADPEKARVIFKMHSNELASDRDIRFSKGPADGLVCYFGGETEMNGVVFDNVVEGGIMVSPAARATWKNIFYGENNLVEPEKLYWDLGQRVQP